MAAVVVQKRSTAPLDQISMVLNRGLFASDVKDGFIEVAAADRSLRQGCDVSFKGVQIIFQLAIAILRSSNFLREVIYPGPSLSEFGAVALPAAALCCNLLAQPHDKVSKRGRLFAVSWTFVLLGQRLR